MAVFVEQRDTFLAVLSLADMNTSSNEVDTKLSANSFISLANGGPLTSEIRSDPRCGPRTRA